MSTRDPFKHVLVEFDRAVREDIEGCSFFELQMMLTRFNSRDVEEAMARLKRESFPSSLARLIDIVVEVQIAAQFG